MNKRAENSSDSEPESVGGECKRKQPAARGRGRRGRSTSSGVSQPTNEATAASDNIMQYLTGLYSPVNEVSGQSNNVDSVEMGVSDLKVALKATRDEVATYMQSLTGCPLCIMRCFNFSTDN